MTYNLEYGKYYQKLILTILRLFTIFSFGGRSLISTPVTWFPFPNSCLADVQMIFLLQACTDMFFSNICIMYVSTTFSMFLYMQLVFIAKNHNVMIEMSELIPSCAVNRNTYRGIKKDSLCWGAQPRWPPWFRYCSRSAT